MANGTDIGYGKSIAAVAAGAVSTLVIYIIQGMIGHSLPADVAAAVQTLITTGAVYLTPHTLSK